MTAHPGRSDEYSLDYLLNGMATISPERGIFLKSTYRMHPDVCRFISDAVYDSRLEAEASNANQALVLRPDAHPALRPTGVCHLPIDHHACSQQSIEEARLVKELFGSLLKQRCRDKNRQVHPSGSRTFWWSRPTTCRSTCSNRCFRRGSRRHRGQVSRAGSRGCDRFDGDLKR
jgi:hypothetical protein